MSNAAISWESVGGVQRCAERPLCYGGRILAHGDLTVCFPPAISSADRACPKKRVLVIMTSESNAGPISIPDKDPRLARGNTRQRGMFQDSWEIAGFLTNAERRFLHPPARDGRHCLGSGRQWKHKERQ